jgi:hypothetical protein
VQHLPQRPVRIQADVVHRLVETGDRPAGPCPRAGRCRCGSARPRSRFRRCRSDSEPAGNILRLARRAARQAVGGPGTTALRVMVQICASELIRCRGGPRADHHSTPSEASCSFALIHSCACGDSTCQTQPAIRASASNMPFQGMFGAFRWLRYRAVARWVPSMIV